MMENTPPPQIVSPTLIFQGKKDELVEWQVTQGWVEEVPSGSPLQFYLYDQYNHHTVIPTAMSITIPKMLEHFNGQKISHQQFVKTV
jgi:hypothetical protein